MHISSDRCRFIAGDPRAVLTDGDAIYCGKPVDGPGSSWCAEHHRVCFEPPMPRDRQARKLAA